MSWQEINPQVRIERISYSVVKSQTYRCMDLSITLSTVKDIFLDVVAQSIEGTASGV
jgi:hypothetical protein